MSIHNGGVKEPSGETPTQLLCISHRRQWIRPQSLEARGFYRKGVGLGEELARFHMIGPFKHQQTVNI